MADELEDQLQGLLGEKFENALSAKVAAFGGLLTRRAAIRLLCKEKGIATERKVLLSDAAAETLPFSFSARVDRIFPVQNFASGERCVRLHLSDDAGGQCTLVLWNAQCDAVEGSLSIGDMVECAGAYYRSGEIHVGKEGKLAAAKKFPITPVGKLTAGNCSTEGVVKEVYLDYGYRDKKTGEEKSMSSFLLCEEAEAAGKGGESGGGGGGEDKRAGGEPDACRRVAVWSAPAGTPKPKEGDTLVLENVLFRNGEIHFNSFSRMVRTSSPEEKSGLLSSVKIRGNTAVFAIGKGKFSLPLADALALLGISHVPEGVEPSTVLSIKAGALAGKNAKYRLADGKLCWLKIEHAS